MLDIKVLGPGCDNCKKVEAMAKQAVANLGVGSRDREDHRSGGVSQVWLAVHARSRHQQQAGLRRTHPHRSRSDDVGGGCLELSRTPITSTIFEGAETAGVRGRCSAPFLR